MQIQKNIYNSETFARTVHPLFFPYSDDFFRKCVSENSKLCSFYHFFSLF
ncbi:hypothetical protein CCAN11_40010 [Capnocytophaga canimorsus]|uniref:Uncharacterized protein n=1 Tax=Capnocytophaga canimorsus TaxID=28188 RepID=A0A0B7ISQ1_9FLAO|nr:hypothetical protein CCAN11_40010 [Capnocytophaga canimorsus]